MAKSPIVQGDFEPGDFRAGSVGAIIRRCGKAGCRCSQPADPGHGPDIRLAYKTEGKTHSESLKTVPERQSGAGNC
jgi:uncharacterized protein DUF6788